MQKLKQYFYNPTCFHCQSFLVEEHLFCEICYEQVIKKRISLKARDIQIDQKSVKHFYLFDWFPGESDLLSKMVYQLKSDRCVKALNFYTEKLISELKFKNIDLILPLPGSQKSSVHSSLIATQAAKILNKPIFNILTKHQTERAQKTKSLSERVKTKIGFRKNKDFELFTQHITNKPCLLYVDDILTTGNTFISARKILSVQSDDCIATLFYRPKTV